MFFKLFIWFWCCFAFNLTLTSANEEDNVRHYTAETFPIEIIKENHFVMFYAPWCAHCKRLKPTWEQLADVLNDDPDIQILIAKVDCTIDSNLCSENDVTGYPTLKFFKKGTKESIRFRGTRDLSSLVSFINEQLGRPATERITVTPVTVDGLTELTESSLNDHIQKGNFFVKFYAPWCGHCQKLVPTWKNLAKSLEDDKNVGIAKLDCTVYRTTCNNFDIKGYPTLLWIQDGKVIEKYQGPVTEPDLKSYVNKMLGMKETKVNEGAVTLNTENFQQGISQGISFVKFFAPWCGHCKRLAPIWNELSKKVEGKSHVRLLKVDCTLENSKELCHEQEVEGFPTLYLYKNGEKLSEYNGSKNLEDMYDFLSKHFSYDEL